MVETANIHKAGAVLLRDRHLLVTRARGKDIFVAPGGKLKPGENAAKALLRELVEEVQIEANAESLESLGTFSAIAAGHEELRVEMEVFIVNDWKGEPIPSNEVEEIRWINSVIDGNLRLGSIFEHEVIPRLKDMDLID